MPEEEFTKWDILESINDLSSDLHELRTLEIKHICYVLSDLAYKVYKICEELGIDDTEV